MAARKKKAAAPDAAINRHIRDACIPTSLQGLYRRAMTGNSQKDAIRAFCLECQGWTDDARAAVRDCEARECPLWRFRG